MDYVHQDDSNIVNQLMRPFTDTKKVLSETQQAKQLQQF